MKEMGRHGALNLGPIEGPPANTLSPLRAIYGLKAHSERRAKIVQLFELNQRLIWFYKLIQIKQSSKLRRDYY